MTNEKIIEEIKNGNENVLNLVYSKYRNEFIVFAIRKFHIDKERLKEIYQDVILSFHNNIVQGKLTRLTCNLKTYLFEIGIRLIGKELRKHTIPLVDEIEFDERFLADIDSFSEKDSKGILKIVRDEMNLLGEKCFDLLYLFYFKNRAMEDIAVTMKFTNSDSAKSQKYKCLERLKVAVKEKHGLR